MFRLHQQCFWHTAAFFSRTARWFFRIVWISSHFRLWTIYLIWWPVYGNQWVHHLPWMLCWFANLKYKNKQEWLGEQFVQFAKNINRSTKHCSPISLSETMSSKNWVMASIAIEALFGSCAPMDIFNFSSVWMNWFAISKQMISHPIVQSLIVVPQPKIMPTQATE